MNVLDLCSGIGGMSLGIALADDSARTVCYVEREAFCAAHLAEKARQGLLDDAPVWTDLTTFEGEPWRGVVDLVTAGFPCQPFSAAGKRLGTDDERWIWPDIARIIREVEPGIVFLENVPPLVAHGLSFVLGDLAELGFDAEWDVFSAAEVGAPHLRKRVFIMARHPDRMRESTQPVDDEASGVSGVAANAERDGRKALAKERRQRITESPEPIVSRPAGSTPNTHSPRLEER